LTFENFNLLPLVRTLPRSAIMASNIHLQRQKKQTQKRIQNKLSATIQYINVCLQDFPVYICIQTRTHTHTHTFNRQIQNPFPLPHSHVRSRTPVLLLKFTTHHAKNKVVVQERQNMCIAHVFIYTYKRTYNHKCMHKCKRTPGGILVSSCTQKWPDAPDAELFPAHSLDAATVVCVCVCVRVSEYVFTSIVKKYM